MCKTDFTELATELVRGVTGNTFLFESLHSCEILYCPVEEESREPPANEGQSTTKGVGQQFL